jgi:hypothetical protein
VTTTEPQPASGPPIGYTPNPVDPMRLWLEANGISMDAIPMWPEIEIKDGQMRVELLPRWDDQEQHQMLGQPFTYMSAWLPLVEPLEEATWEAYDRCRDRAMAERALEKLARNGAAVLAVIPGDNLTFVTQQELDMSTMEDVREHLERALPGVTVTILTGVDTVVRAPAQP